MVLEKEWLQPMEERFCPEDVLKVERELVFPQNFNTRNND